MKSSDLMKRWTTTKLFYRPSRAGWRRIRHCEISLFEFAPAAQETSANIGAERLDDILTNLIDGMAGHMEIRLSGRKRIDPAAFGKRRLDLYNRTLGWLGGSLEYNQDNGGAEFVMRLPALQSI